MNMNIRQVLATAATALALSTPLLSQAAAIKSTYSPLGGADWSVALTVSNDGVPASIIGFTVYFPETRYTNLQLTAAPAGWDPLVTQPDLGLPAAGFLDFIGLTPADVIGAGQSLGGFVGKFTLLGGGVPAALPFTINDAAFNVLFSGSTNVAVVPEPATVLLALLGLAACGGGGAARRTRRAASATTEGITA
jgi:hypothetical protein